MARSFSEMPWCTGTLVGRAEMVPGRAGAAPLEERVPEAPDAVVAAAAAVLKWVVEVAVSRRMYFIDGCWLVLS